ncbi:peptidase [Maricaulaceae bacterium EIL42A08]|nr:peptidase [Maricaulaceae bacterium EIL42A08]
MSIRSAFASAMMGAFAFTASAIAEPIEFFQVDGVIYDQSVQSPEDAFGYEIGERPVRVGDMVSYLRSIANGSDRIQVETIGYSHQRRPILFFTVTSPENHARLDEIREAHHARMRGEEVPADTPMVLWINFGVHGAEASGMDAAIPTIYHFAAGDSDQIDTMLDDSVMVFTAVFNPDGHSRRVDHVETFWSRADNTDPADMIHNLWTEARVNHYWFDLNRQWLLLTQPESQAWIAKWHEWKPMVSADYHEMGSAAPFYFHPGEELRRNPLIPERARELTFQIGQRHAEFLDSEARLYTTQERFDNFYIGKGSTYPQINGSLGILYEIGAARGGAIQTERGLVTHADNVRTQFRTVLTTVQGALDLRSEITDYQRQFFADAAADAERDRRRNYVFTAAGDPERAARFVRLLRMHDIDVYETSADLSAGGQTFPAGESYVVPLDQQQYRMIQGIFERVTEFEENIFYDVSGWTLPLAYDLEYATISNARLSEGAALADGGFEVAPAPDRSSYGYVIEWSQTYAPRALNRILAEGIMARAANEEFTVNTTRGPVSLGRGSVFVPLARQDADADDIFAIMQTIAAEDGVPVHATTSGLTPTTGRDLGATNVFRALEQPRVVLAFNDGLSRYDAGEIWWTLDFQHDMPVTLVEKDDLGSVDWSDYTHLVLVGGNASLPDGTRDMIQNWIRRDGGTLIATRQGARWAQGAFFNHGNGDSDASESETPERVDFAEMALRDAQHVIGGAIFEADLDTSHPLGFGFANRQLPVHRNVSFTLERPDGDPYAVPLQYTDEPLLTGYASERRQEEIAGTPSIVSQRQGRGAIILMADNPVFRATYPGTERLLMNAIFFSDLIDRPRGDYEE